MSLANRYVEGSMGPVFDLIRETPFGRRARVYLAHCLADDLNRLRFGELS